MRRPSGLFTKIERLESSFWLLLFRFGLRSLPWSLSLRGDFDSSFASFFVLHNFSLSRVLQFRIDS